jgi:hypothetical protein
LNPFSPNCLLFRACGAQSWREAIHSQHWCEEEITARKYGTKSRQSVKRAMQEMKHGELKSGKSGKKVTNPKQAIAIGLSEARKKGAKVPPPKTKAK